MLGNKSVIRRAVQVAANPLRKLLFSSCSSLFPPFPSQPTDSTACQLLQKSTWAIPRELCLEATAELPMLAFWQIYSAVVVRRRQGKGPGMANSPPSSVTSQQLFQLQSEEKGVSWVKKYCSACKTLSALILTVGSEQAKIPEPEAMFKLICVHISTSRFGLGEWGEWKNCILASNFYVKIAAHHTLTNCGCFFPKQPVLGVS